MMTLPPLRFPFSTRLLPACAAAFLVTWSANANAASPARADHSLKLEIGRALEKGLDWLASRQDAESGAWGDPRYPALSALPICALLGAPSRAPDAPLDESLLRGLEFLLSRQREDGGIYGNGLATYNTALSLLALTLAAQPEYDLPILQARKFLIAQQADFDTRGTPDNPFDGGIGYGGTYTHSDLSNTHLALEALYYSRNLLSDSAAAPGKEGNPQLDWDAAIAFVQRCQHSAASNDQEWSSDDPENRGGFIYYPGDSKAGSQRLEDGRTVPRSYGSMSYAGLLSFIYARMDRGDPRVLAARDWLQKNYSVEENPGMGHEGLYYYYHTMAKALTILDVKELKLAGGDTVDWRSDLATRLFDLQESKGFWVNDTGRWWEKDPILVTAYALLTLEHIYHSL